MAHSVLAGYEPASVLAFFEDICAIPHVSGDERALADYVEAFARARGLACHRDAVHNVFIRLPASAGCEGAPAVLLQGHLDMVGEKDADSTHDFATDGLKLRVDEEQWLWATGTTLGGDDGIAVAMMLAMLDTPPARHPAIECLFTVSEETGLEGAWAFDPTAAKAATGAGVTARYMINLDSEAEGVLTAGCSGGMRTDLTIPVAVEPAGGVALTVELSGLSGGHSGVEIHEGHTNAIKALGRMLRAAERVGKPRLTEVSGGGKDNAIPRDARAVVIVPEDGAEAVAAALRAEAEAMRGEPNFVAADSRLTCNVTVGGDAPAVMMTEESHRAVVAAINLVRDGVLSMSAHMEGLVAYSRNLGILTTLTDEGGRPVAVRLSTSTRSASGSHLDDAVRELDELAAVLTVMRGETVTATHRARYPGWDFAPVSPLRDLWTSVSETLFGVTPRIEVIHAGLECGILCDKLPEMDIISVGPDMRDIHTPRECISIPSIERTWRLVLAVVEKLAD